MIWYDGVISQTRLSDIIFMSLKPLIFTDLNGKTVIATCKKSSNPIQLRIGLFYYHI